MGRETQKERETVARFFMAQAACHACLLPEHAPILPDVERIVMSLPYNFSFLVTQ